MTLRVLFTALALVRHLCSLSAVDDLTLLASFTCWISPTAQRRVCQQLTSCCRACSAQA